MRAKRRASCQACAITFRTLAKDFCFRWHVRAEISPKSIILRCDDTRVNIQVIFVLGKSKFIIASMFICTSCLSAVVAPLSNV